MRSVAVLAASDRELGPARSALGFFGTVQRGRLGPFPHTVGQRDGLEWHLVKTGVGPERSREASEAVIAACAPEVLISTGYAGALGLATVGEVILGTTMLDWTKGPGGEAIEVSHGWLARAREAARQAGVPWTQGPVVTVGRILWRASEKQALGTVSGAIAVEMEGAVIAMVAAAAGVPFLPVRAISDPAEEDLPMDFNLWFSSFGSWRCLRHIAQRPAILRDLYRMKGQADQASESLRRFFCALLNLRQEPARPSLAGLSGAAL